MAKKLAEYHSIPSDDVHPKKKSELVDKLRHYLHLLNGINPQLRERLQLVQSQSMDVLSTIKSAVGLQSSSPSLDSLESEFDYSWSQLSNDLDQTETIFDENWSNVPVVLCHNYTQSRNFLLEKQTNILHMVDFEHCFNNFYLFDIENYFVEFAGLGSSPNWPKKYPSKERRKNFLAEYVKHARFFSHTYNDDELDQLCDRAHRLIALTHLYWSLWAILQSMINPQALSQFDYVTYSKSRFHQYKLHKDTFFNI